MMENINSNWRDVQENTIDIFKWDPKTFYELGTDFAELLFFSTALKSDEENLNANQ